MRKLQITLIALFLAVAIAFCAVFLHDRLTADHTAPRIVSDGVPLEVSVNATDAELCAGLTAADDRDGDLTDRIIVRRVSQLTGANSAQATYTVFDSASTSARSRGRSTTRIITSRASPCRSHSSTASAAPSPCSTV
mgnify:CR=1 FL=1